MDDEFKIQLVIVPEIYDYNEEEIVYRIYFEDQLISERSLPILENNQALVDTFYIKNSNAEIFRRLFFTNLKSKKCIIKNLIINNRFYPNTYRFKLKNLSIHLTTGYYK